LAYRRVGVFVRAVDLFGVAVWSAALKLWNRILRYFQPTKLDDGRRVIVRMVWSSKNGGYIVTAKLSAWLKWQTSGVVDEYPLFRVVPVSSLKDYKLMQEVEL